MHLEEAGWQVSARLRRMRSLLWARVVEAKLIDLERALKTNFDPNQPRVPAGNPDGGQWTSTGGGRGDTSDSRVAQVSRGGRRRGSDADATPARAERASDRERRRARAAADVEHAALPSGDDCLDEELLERLEHAIEQLLALDPRSSGDAIPERCLVFACGDIFVSFERGIHDISLVRCIR